MLERNEAPQLLMRTIETKTYAALQAPTSFGPPPRLEWLAIAALVIDPLYQREITLAGRKNVRRIAEAFDWSKFSPVVVAPAGSNRYAIVDGQHRVTAAALVGIERVPCAVIDGNRAAQADAFRSINGNVTRMHSVQIFHAKLAAGNAEAQSIAQVCDAAGVRIVRAPTQVREMKPGETMAVGTIARCVAKFGEAATVAGLKAIVATGGGNPGLLNQAVVFGTAEVLADHPEWIADEKRLHAAFDTLDLDDLYMEARSVAARTRGTSIVDQFEARLVGGLERHLKES